MVKRMRRARIINMYLQYHTLTDLYLNVRRAQVFIDSDPPLNTYIRIIIIIIIMLRSMISIILAEGQNEMRAVTQAAYYLMTTEEKY